jgi:hypothetical protein
MNIETITEQALKLEPSLEHMSQRYCWKAWIMKKTSLFQKHGGKKYKNAVWK